MRRAIFVSLALLVVSCAWTEGLVANADFEIAPQGQPERAEGWLLPETGWVRVPEAGPEGGAVLRVRVAGGAVEPARQWLDYARPKATYSLRVVARSDALRPTARIVDRESGEEIARVTVDAGDAWQEAAVEFEARTANLGLELYADVGHLDGGDTPEGTAEFASGAVSMVAGDAGRPGPDLGENLALGRPYEIPPGSYGLCTDPGDAQQLTDGEYTEGYFWTQESTVGWKSSGVKFITIDLGRDYPIRGAAYSTAAGVADVQWPERIVVFVSEDGDNWYRVGDLVQRHIAREPLPPIGEYATEVIWADGLDTHGRYVKLAVFPEGSYIFVDEIEVYRGPDHLLDREYRSAVIPDIELYMLNEPIRELHRRELAVVRTDIAATPASERTQLEARADALEAAIDEMPPIELEGFRAVLPLSEVERRIFELQAEVWRAQGKDRIRLWQKHRWDPLGPGDEPRGDEAPAGLRVEMMRNETRADVLNITSAGPRDTRIRLRITGLPGGTSPDWITVREVKHVGSRFIPSVAAPLPVARRSGEWWIIEAPAGVTTQVWFEIDSGDLGPGTWEGAVELHSVPAGRQSVPLRVTVHPLTMPDRKTLNVGGWSYTDANSYGLTPENVDQVIAHLRERGVNAPWATSASLPPGRFDAEGSMVAEPDTTRFDAWVAKWPNCNIYLVFAAVGDTFAGAQVGTERFNRQVGQWARFWADHAAQLGLEPGQLGVLLVDEPNSVEDYERITAWARPITEAAPEIVIWEDPFDIDDREPMLEMFELADILCPMRIQYIAGDDEWRETLEQHRQGGTELWFYSCSDPARTFDPCAYYLAQAWHAYEIGARGSCFWAFADVGGASSWNDYTSDGAGSYSPLYIDPTSATTAKPMEAIRESQQDFEYLVMLEQRIEELEATGARDRQIEAARRLLEEGPARVVGDHPEQFDWRFDRDRGVADQVRHQILRALLSLDGQAEQ